MCVLLVEDEVAIRLTLVDFMEDVGLRVLEAWDASAALSLLETPPEAIEVLVTDLNLGLGDNGLVLADKARSKLPNLRVIYITGNPNLLRDHPMQPWERLFVKPFDVNKLISELLSLSASNSNMSQFIISRYLH